MTIVIEDGTVVTGGNSFVTTAEFDTYLTDRGYTAIASPEPPLIRAFDYMAVLPWCDPHDEAYTVTDGMKLAQMDIAFQINAGFNPAAVRDSQTVKREKVDVIEQEYFSGGNYYDSYDILKRLPFAYSLIDSLLCPTVLLERA